MAMPGRTRPGWQGIWYYSGWRGGGGTSALPGREGLLIREGRLGRDLLGRDGRERLGRERLLGGEGRRDGRLLRDGREGLLLCGGLSAAQASLMEKSTGEVYTTPAAARAARTRRRCLLNLSWRESEFGLFIAVSHG